MNFIRIIMINVAVIHDGIADIAIRGTIHGMIPGSMADTPRGIMEAGDGIFTSAGTARGTMVGMIPGITVGMIPGSTADGDIPIIGAEDIITDFMTEYISA
jgi:hypothetical protein